MVSDIRKIIPKVGNIDSFKSWAQIANDELLLSILI